MLDYQYGGSMLNTRLIQRGISLIEFMIGIVIIGVLLALAVPSFKDWIQSSQVRTASESIMNGLQLARTDAVHLNTVVRFNLNSSAGLVNWEVCSIAATPCPAANILQQHSSKEGSTNARVGVYKIGDGQPQTAFSTVVAAGNEMPTHVSFNGLGRTINDGPDNTARIDVTNALS